MTERAWVKWSPAWAPTIEGEFEEPQFEGGMPLPQKWRARCLVPGCGGKFEGTCSSGTVRSHISRYASVHVPEHQEPLSAPRVVHPASRRTGGQGSSGAP